MKELLWLGILSVSGFVLAGLISYMFGWGDVGWMLMIIPVAAWVFYAFVKPGT